VPDVPSFAVDDGFWYSVPPHLAASIMLGSLVRVPLSGRRVRGWVVELGKGPNRALKEISGVSGAAPVFDESLMKSLNWMSSHYVAPVPVLLAKATPPNLPQTPDSAEAVTTVPGPDHPLAAVAGVAARDGKIPAQAILGQWRAGEWLSALGPVLTAGKSAMVVAASAAEASRVAKWGRRHFGGAVIDASGDDNAELTRAWSDAQAPGRLLVGTPRVATWGMAALTLAVVLEEGRRAMKERQTPTLHVRDVLHTRSRLEGFTPVFLGPTPSVEILSAGAKVRRVGGRAWGLVEVVDRSEEPPGSGFLSGRVIAALKATAGKGERCFVFTHRRTGAASLRCVTCRAIRACGRCGAYVGRVEACPRCGAHLGPCAHCGSGEFEEMGTVPQRLVTEINRALGRGFSAVHPADTKVTVGTERDLAALPPVALAVAADADGMLMGTGYRTTEEALRQLARVATAVERGRGARMMVQTSHPDSDLMQALRRGDPIPYLERVLNGRSREGMPPSVEMIALELRGQVPRGVVDDLEPLPGATVLGPAKVDEGERWLLTGDLGSARLRLRDLVGRWREEGVTVRVDADPIDL
jgi:primosomal protein N' (replication factor Y)